MTPRQPASAVNQPFTRLYEPDRTTISDIYDKLAASSTYGQGVNAVAQRALTLAQQASAAASSSGGGGGGGSTAIVPEVAVLPPITPDLPDGELVLYLRVLWRYSKDRAEWEEVSTISIQDTHANRSTYDASIYDTGVLFFETDTQVFLLNQTLSSLSFWSPFLANNIRDTHALRAGVTSTVDTVGTAVTATVGTPFTASMVGRLVSIGFVLYTVAAFTNSTHITLATSAGTHSGLAFLFTPYPASIYPAGTLYNESDRGVVYIDAAASGTVGTVGTAVTRTTGPSFDPYWAGGRIVINAVSYQIASVTDASHLVLTSSAGTQVAIAYSLPSGVWKYMDGLYADLLANIPSGLTTDDTGYLFGATDYAHQYRWGGVVWAFALGDPGSKYIVAGIDAPLGGLWALCDGSGTTVATPTGGTAGVTTPNLTGDIFVKGGIYTGTRQAATQATWDAAAKTEDANLPTFQTDDEMAHTHVIPVVAATIINYTAGPSPQTVITAVSTVTDPGSPHHHQVTTGVTTAHNHTLTNTNAKLNKPSEADGGLPLRMNMQWYMRC